MGMAVDNIGNGVNGEVISFGTLKNLDTRGSTASAIAVGDETWAEGDVLYAHPTVAGKLTKVRPQHDLAVAFITVRHASSGQLAVRIVPGNFHLEWLHDVSITSPLDKQVIKYDAASSLWVNGVASGGVTTGTTPPASPNAGDAWYDTTDGLLYIWYVDADSSQWVEVKANSALETTLLTRVATLEANQTPSGVIMQFAGATAPAGYLLCDGTAVSRTTYAGLFTAISTTYGVGDNSTTFNLPDLRGRVPVGKNGGTFGTIGATGGAETHTLTEAQMPSHTHTQDSHNHTQNSHNHTQNAHNHTSIFIDSTQLRWGAGFAGGGTGGVISNAGGGQIPYTGSTTATNNAVTATNQATTATNQNTGGGQAHNNLQPYIVTNYIIKT
jgi:microcystin-dependent protein